MQVPGFEAVWALDTEFKADPGARPQSHCLVAHELVSGRVVRCWLADGAAPTEPPFEIGEHSLCVAYFSSAEWGCFLSLGWELPVHVLDLYVEFRRITNGIPPPHGAGLLGALHYFGLSTIDAEEKTAMRELAMRGGPFTQPEQAALVEYCEGDVRALELLLPSMLPYIDVPRALIRGRYMKSVARMEATGIPIDVELHRELVEHWSEIKQGLVAAAHESFGVFPDGSFSQARFANWLTAHGMEWPMTKSGHLAVDQDTFRDMTQVYPALGQLQQTLHVLGKLRLTDLAIGPDSRNRTLLSPFRARTSRNQPSTTKYVFGLAAWLRNLIRPAPGRAIAYLDYEQQEFAIGAVLSGDRKMIEAYESGDAYLAFAKQAGAVPPHATANSHKRERKQYKQCALGVQYGMREVSLARRIEKSPAHARELLEAHQRTYSTYWAWTESVVEFAMLHGWVETVLGWRQNVGPDANARSLANFASQANGAEMLRLACIFATESGVNVCGPIHDALLIEDATDGINDSVARAKQAMAGASRVVLNGFEVRVDDSVGTIVRFPERYQDERGETMWGVIGPLLEHLRR